jgi:multicomponent Na+:H+ antiporter subunit G
VAEIISYGLMLFGAFFIFVAGLGVLRFPDLFMRMHANTKSATLGVGCIMLGTALYFGEISVTTRAMAVVIFLFITAPISAHLLSRASYFSGIPLWDKTLSDELRGHYDMRTHEIQSDDIRKPLPNQPRWPLGSRKSGQD